MDVGFVLVLSFHHGDLEPDCVEVSTRKGGLMRGIKIPPHNFLLKMQGGLMHGIKIPPHNFLLKMQGGLMRKGGRICGTLR